MSNSYGAIGSDFLEKQLPDAINNGAFEGVKINAGIKETPIDKPTAPRVFNK